MIPERISHYQILKKLGSGGMGEVYLAEDTNLGRTVAVKILPSEVAADATRLRRFIQEAKAASSLKHPSVAGIYDLGEENGLPFIVMELVEGDTLDARVKGQPMDVPHILDFAIQVADALEEAHSKGVIHRDIKPANIMITQKGQVKVLDFGLAKVMSSSSSDSNLSKIATETGTEPGLVLGTVQYMSPEQALGKTVDHRSDLFSFGIVLYQMTTGRLPFSAESATETINRIVNNPPDAVARYNYSCPPELEHMIRKSLEKDPDRRYQSAHELLIDLKNLKRDTESGTTQMRTTATIQKPASRRWWPAAAGAVVLIGIGLFLFFQRTRTNKPDSTEPAEQERKMIAVLPFENLGAAEEQYFAEGMTDEITSRLATVKELGVVSRSSAMQYQKTNKSTKQIGQELGVDYLLEGTIRWSRSSGNNRVRVTPQLIRVADDTQVWSNIYDQVINDVFQVQSDIAQGVIAQLGVTLGESRQKTISAAPTSNLEAYQAFLHGNEHFLRASYDRETLQEAVRDYQRSVTLDPSFALAYSYLARSHLHLFHEGYDSTPTRLNLAKTAVDKALELQPNSPAASIALGYYRYHGLGDYAGALEAFTRAAAMAPNDADVLSAIAFVERRQGKFEGFLRHMKTVLELDPRAADMPSEVGVVLTRLRKYEEAQMYYDRSLQLDPDQVYGYTLRWANIILWKGDLKAGRSILEKMPEKELPFFHNAWVWQEILERNYQKALDRLESIPVDLFQQEGQYIPRPLLQAQVYQLMNQTEKAAEYYRRANSFLEQKKAENASNPAFHSALGFTYAGLGRKADAIREGKLATEMLPLSRDPFRAPSYMEDLAAIYTMTGNYDLALDQLNAELAIPSWISVAKIELDPTWDPLRKLPRYEQLIAKYSGKKS